MDVLTNEVREQCRCVSFIVFAVYRKDLTRGYLCCNRG